MAKKLALTFGVVFLVVGILGLLGGVGIVGESGMFMTDSVHDWVHIISGIIFLVVGLAAPARAAVTMIALGIIYLLVAILGFVGNNPVLGFINVNGADNWLHLILGAVILWAGYSNKKRGDITPMQ
jgi:hypothetical protein